MKLTGPILSPSFSGPKRTARAKFRRNRRGSCVKFMIFLSIYRARNAPPVTSPRSFEPYQHLNVYMLIHLQDKRLACLVFSEPALQQQDTLPPGGATANKTLWPGGATATLQCNRTLGVAVLRCSLVHR